MQRWELSARLRELRHEAGLTIEQVAQALLCSPAKVSRMETGERSVQLRDVRDLAVLYRLPDAERDRLAALARGAREKAWYDAYKLPAAAAEFYGVETAAREIWWVETALVPGVCQTPEYTEEVLRVLGGLPEQSLLKLEDQLEIRRHRQRILLDGRVDLNVLLTEESLRHRAGNPSIMCEQLLRLAAVSELANVDLRILKMADSLAAAAAGPFIVMSLHSTRIRDRIFWERGLRLSDDEDDVSRFLRFYDELRAVALSPSASLELLREIAGEWQSEMGDRVI